MVAIVIHPPDVTKADLEYRQQQVYFGSSGQVNVVGPQPQPPVTLPVCMQGAFSTRVPVGKAAARALTEAKELFGAYVRGATGLKPIEQLLPPEYRAHYTTQAKGSHLLYLDVLEPEKKTWTRQHLHRQVISFYPEEEFHAVVPFHLTDDAGRQFAAHVSSYPGCAALRRRLTDAQKDARGLTTKSPVVLTWCVVSAEGYTAFRAACDQGGETHGVAVEEIASDSDAD